MRFEARDVSPYRNDVKPSDLIEGGVYFIVRFVDHDMAIPEVKPVVFVGRNLEPEDKERLLYFQDISSYNDGIRFETPLPDGSSDAVFESFYEDQGSGVCAFDEVLESMLRCSLRRKERGERGSQ